MWNSTRSGDEITACYLAVQFKKPVSTSRYGIPLPVLSQIRFLMCPLTLLVWIKPFLQCLPCYEPCNNILVHWVSSPSSRKLLQETPTSSSRQAWVAQLSNNSICNSHLDLVSHMLDLVHSRHDNHFYLHLKAIYMRKSNSEICNTNTIMYLTLWHYCIPSLLGKKVIKVWG